MVLFHFLPAFIMKRAAEAEPNCEYDYFSDEDDAWEHAMVRSLDRTEQLGGALGPLFSFRLQQIGRRRRWRETTDHFQFNATLVQERDTTPGDNLGSTSPRPCTVPSEIKSYHLLARMISSTSPFKRMGSPMRFVPPI